MSGGSDSNGGMGMGGGMDSMGLDGLGVDAFGGDNLSMGNPKGATVPGYNYSGRQLAQQVEPGLAQEIMGMTPEQHANKLGLSLTVDNNYNPKDFSIPSFSVLGYDVTPEINNATVTIGPITKDIDLRDPAHISPALDTVNAITDAWNNAVNTSVMETATGLAVPYSGPIESAIEGLRDKFGQGSTESGVVDDGVNLHGTNLDADYNAAFGTDYGYNVGPSLNQSPSFDMGAVSQAGGEDLQRLIALRKAMAQQAAKKIINVSNDIGLTPEDIQDILPPSTSTPPSGGGGNPPPGGGSNPPPSRPKKPNRGGRDGSANNPSRPVETAADRLVRVITAPKISKSVPKSLLRNAIKTGNVVGSDNQVDLINQILNPPKTLTKAQQINQSGRGGLGS